MRITIDLDDALPARDGRLAAQPAALPRHALETLIGGARARRRALPGRAQPARSVARRRRPGRSTTGAS